MIRFLLGLLCAGGLFWSYDRWLAGDSQATAEGTSRTESGQPAASNPDGGDRDAPVAHAPLRGAPRPEQFMDMTLDEFLGAVDEGREEARDAAWDLVSRADPSSRAQLAKGLLERIRSAPDPTAALELLGQRNRFLHTEEGRQGALLVAERIGETSDPEQVTLGTRLIEVCMRGSLSRDQREARGTVDRIYEQHSKAVYRHVFNPANLTRAERYVVQPGDVLSRIASRFSKRGQALDAGTIALVNRIHNIHALRADQVLKIPRDRFKTVVEKGTFLMAMYLGTDIIRLYWVGHGKDGYTPEAEFVVGEKLKDPAWYAPNNEVFAHGDPRNILGGYFIKFDHEAHQGFGAHGTPDQDSIATESSMGCIRMLAADIEEFFKIVPPGSSVEIRNTR